MVAIGRSRDGGHCLLIDTAVVVVDLGDVFVKDGDVPGSVPGQVESIERSSLK